MSDNPFRRYPFIGWGAWLALMVWFYICWDRWDIHTPWQTLVSGIVIILGLACVINLLLHASATAAANQRKKISKQEVERQNIHGSARLTNPHEARAAALGKRKSRVQDQEF